jgi:hypothetical protein
MLRLFENVTDLPGQADVLRRRRYGAIEVADETLVRVRLRPFPKVVTVLAPLVWGERFHERQPGNRCFVYYNQPRRHSRFLSVTYAVSSRDCTLATVRLAVRVLDEIARIKSIDALLCDVTHSRITDRLMARLGWQSHAPRRWHRNYIKRFYGAYLPPPADFVIGR